MILDLRADAILLVLPASRITFLQRQAESLEDDLRADQMYCLQYLKYIIGQKLSLIEVDYFPH